MEHKVTSRADGFGNRDCSCGGMWNDADEVCSTLKTLPPHNRTGDDEDVAKEIYEAMRWAVEKAPYQGGVTPPPWVKGGNSLVQEKARQSALAISTYLATPSLDKDALVSVRDALEDGRHYAKQYGAIHTGCKYDQALTTINQLIEGK